MTGRERRRELLLGFGELLWVCASIVLLWAAAWVFA